MLAYIIATIFTILSQQPPDIFRDPNALTLIGIGAGILGVIATVGAAVYTVQQSRTKRTIEWQKISDTPIIAVDSAVAGKIEILVNGQPAKDTRVFVLKIRNAGNNSIRKENYFAPLNFEFDADIISADVLETEPPTLLDQEETKNFLILGKQNVQLPLIPLNSHDALTLTIVVKEKSGVRLMGRIEQGTISQFETATRQKVSLVVNRIEENIIIFVVYIFVVGGINTLLTHFGLPEGIAVAIAFIGGIPATWLLGVIFTKLVNALFD